jgi:membrane fusion protein, multidrug efflux system
VREAQARGPVEVTAFSQDNVNPLSKGTLLLIDNIIDQTSAAMRRPAWGVNPQGVVEARQIKIRPTIMQRRS